jgi:hypothetical protein
MSIIKISKMLAVVVALGSYTQNLMKLDFGGACKKDQLNDIS